MKALVVLAQPPLTEGGAPGKCAVALLRGLARHGVEVTALAARQPYAVPGDPPSDLPVDVIPIEPRAGWRARRERIRRPFGVLSYGEFGSRVRELATEADVIHLEETETGWCDVEVATPALVHFHHLIGLDHGGSVPRPWKRADRFRVEYGLAERAALRRHQHVVASSPVVAAELKRRARGREITLAPLSLDPADYTPAALDGPPIAGIIGSAAWPPTAAAVRQLVDCVWPLIRRQAPDARLLIAGREMDGLVPADPEAGIEVRGEVPSAAEFLRELSVLVFPLERGSGIKVKVLESIACGVPVVTTAAGAEGIEGGEGVVVESEHVAAARAAASMLLDDAERRERGTAGRRAFEQRYSPVPATEPLVELYERLGSR